MSRMANRQLAILRILGNGRKISSSEIAERVEASQKTVLRDLLDLSVDYHIEMVSGNGGGVWMNPASVVGNQFLKRNELVYILDAVTKMPDDNPIKTSVLQKIIPQGRGADEDKGK